MKHNSKSLASHILNPKRKFFWIVFVLLGFAITGLLFAEYLADIKNVLDSPVLTFKVGDISISLYILLKAIITIVVLFWIVNVIAEFFIKKIQKLKKINSNNKILIIKSVQIFSNITAFLIVLNILGVNLTSFAVLSGAIGIGIGFGLQKITSNFISGIILLFEKSIEESDLIELGDGTVGFIKKVNARYTLIETFDSREVMVPNEDFITSKVTNWTFTDTSGRIQIDIGASYGSDLEKVYDLLLLSATEHPRCSNKKPPECYLVDFADSSVNFTIFVWVDDITSGRIKTKSEILFNIWHKFKENNIEIPFPQRDVHIKNT